MSVHNVMCNINLTISHDDRKMNLTTDRLDFISITLTLSTHLVFLGSVMLVHRTHSDL